MARSALNAAIVLAWTGLGLLPVGAMADEAPQIASGRRLAQANCGGCHAVGLGASPLSDAPPFRQLYRRYRAGGLDALLDEGMIAQPPLEEEGQRFHPRMPSVLLDSDQRADLEAYLKSLQPARSHRRRH
jgi:cytochrome c